MSAFPFWVNAVDGLPEPSGQSSSLHVSDLFACDLGDPREQWHSVLLSSFLTDLNWLLGAAPGLRGVRDTLCVLSGQRGTATVTLQPGTARPSSCPENAASPFLMAVDAHRLHRDQFAAVEPPLPFTFGTHHSKFALCVNSKGLRVAVTTANFVRSDWVDKTQGIYIQDFPRLDARPGAVPQCRETAKGTDFREQLKAYLHACGLAAVVGDTGASAAASALGLFSSTAFLDAFDFSDAKVWLVTSTPGNRMASDDVQGGWRRLRTVLARVPSPAGDTRLTWQYSSQGSLRDEFLQCLVDTMVAPGAERCDVAVRVIYPTEQEVRDSLEGWRGGLALPLRMQNCHPFVNERLHRWGIAASRAQSRDGCSFGQNRRYALPHMKTYTRVAVAHTDTTHECGTVVWCLLTSANLSQAAWGTGRGVNDAPQTRSLIRSYEFGVLFDATSVVHPTRTADPFWCVTPSHALRLPTQTNATELFPTPVWQADPSNTSSEPCDAAMMLPYDVISPEPYASNGDVHALNRQGGGTAAQTRVNARDVPWALDFPHRGCDALGMTWEAAMAAAAIDEGQGGATRARLFPPGPKRPRRDDSQ